MNIRYLFLILCSHYLLGAPQTPLPTITVVGAGLAGLTTAYRLQALGYPVEVYEARERPGGRVLTAYFPTTYDELGGKNIDDASDPTELLNLIQELGLPILSSTAGDLRQRVSVVDGKMQPFLLGFKEGPPPSEETHKFLQSQLNQMGNLANLIHLFLKNAPIACKQMLWSMGLYEGTNADNLSPYYLDLVFWPFYKKYYELSQNPASPAQTTYRHRSIAGGNTLLINALADRLKGHIHYNCPLRKLSRSKKDGRIQLHFEKTAPITTDYLVLALPCSTLRDVAIEDGLIPQDQLVAIQTVQYGSNAKILLPVAIDEKLWGRCLLTQHLATWLNQDRSVMTWYLLDNGKEGDAQSTDGLNAKIEDSIEWVQKLYPGIEFPLGTIPGKKQEPVYRAPIAISWSREEFSKGSYSNYSPDTFDLLWQISVDEGEQVRTVFRSINHQIFFAGEHTDIDDFATMGGAVRSGDKAARMLEKVLKRKLSAESTN